MHSVLASTVRVNLPGYASPHRLTVENLGSRSLCRHHQRAKSSGTKRFVIISRRCGGLSLHEGFQEFGEVVSCQEVGQCEGAPAHGSHNSSEVVLRVHTGRERRRL
jgi:hypothetical protein